MPKFIFSLFFLFLVSHAFGQTDAQRKLEERKEQLQKEIREAESALQNEKQKQLQFFQKVSFKPIIKSFGSTKKEVWTLFLGEVTLP